MIAFPAGVKVWIAGGVTDMRCGMNSLALKVQQGLGRDPHGGEIFCFRGRKGDLLKIVCERYERPTFRRLDGMTRLRPNFARRTVGWTKTALMPCIKTCLKPVIIGGSR